MISVLSNDASLSACPDESEDCPSSIQLYLTEIGAIPRLSVAEEKKLATKVGQGDAEAKRRCILANLRLVVSVAKKYGTTDLDLLDHVQNGYFGLLEAVERFDPAFGVRFSTYAMYWIRQAIVRGQEDTARLIRLPSYIQGELRKLDKEAEAWLQKHKTEASVEHLASCLDVSVEHIQLLQRAREWALSIDGFNEMDEEGTTLTERLADPRAETPYLAVDRSDEYDAVHQALRLLNKREQAAVSLYFGLGVEEMSGYAEIGRAIGVSRTRARQLVTNALPKLRLYLEWLSEPSNMNPIRCDTQSST